ncbi:MAG: hypothetical protein GX308_08655 [Epulopiscium sp.]|nr:hypothetical protein [Candidatus Epulonipiscium sp.]
MKNIIQQLKNEGIACLFSILLVYWMMGILCDKYKLIGLFLVAMIHIVLFAFFLYCKWQKEVGNKGVEILFVFVFIVYISIAIFIIKTTSLAKGSSYGLWFIYGSNTGNIDIGYWVGSILLVSFLFGGTVFYFTNIRFRIWVILLLSMIVFIMETTKGSLGITFDFIIFCFLFFILYTEYENKMKGNSILFVFITLGITLIIPKPDVLPQIPVMDAIIYGTVKTLGGNVQILTGGNGINRLNGSILTTKRFINGGLVPDGKEVLFEVEGKEPLYLRMQSFDQYEKNYWYTGEGSLDNGGILKKEYYKRNAQKFNTIISILDKLKDEGWMEENFSNIYKYLEYPSYPQRVNRAQVILKNHYTKSFFNPLGVFGIKEMGRERNIYISQSTICFLGMGESIDLNSKYYIDYISQGITPNSREFGVMTQMNKKLLKIYP